MPDAQRRTICWIPLWNEKLPGIGLEHLLLGPGEADSIVVGVDEIHGAFRIAYRLAWDESWQLQEAELTLETERSAGSLHLRSDGRGHWHHADGEPIPELEGCIDIDIWPTPFTNSFPIRRSHMSIGEQRQFRMAWVSALNLSVHPQTQRYTRLAQRVYLFESLDGSGFRSEIVVDEDYLVTDYPGLFRRVDLDDERHGVPIP